MNTCIGPTARTLGPLFVCGWNSALDADASLAAGSRTNSDALGGMVIMRCSGLISLVVVVLTLLVSPTQASSAVQGEDIVVGRSITLRSKIYEKEIRLLITLPGDYDETEERYPVLYTVQAYFLHTAGTVEQLSRGQIPKMVYVHVDTYDAGDFVPTEIEGRASSGGADRFIDFFEQELIPFIDSHYRTQPFRILQSSSWGGVFCLYTALTRPDVFNSYIAATPWLIYDGDDKYMLSHAQGFLKDRSYDRRFLFMALGNDRDPGLREGFNAISEVLRDYAGHGLRFTSFFWEDEDHWSTQHKAVYEGLKWTFADWRDIPDEVLEAGPDAIRAYRKKVARLYGYDIGIATATLGMYGMRRMREGKADQAIAMLELRAEWSPDQPWGFEQLGRAYEAAGRLMAAKNSFETAYRLAKQRSAPDLTRFRNHVKRIEKSLSAQTPRHGDP
jgi:predicted alpha/beta superfamily hydrolase